MAILTGEPKRLLIILEDAMKYALVLFLLAATAAKSSDHYACGAYANIGVTKANLESEDWKDLPKEYLVVSKNGEMNIHFPLWKDLIQAEQGEVKVDYSSAITFSFQNTKISESAHKLSGRITSHLNRVYSAYGESDGKELLVRLEDPTLTYLSEDIMKEHPAGKQAIGKTLPNIKSIELSCSLTQ